MDLLAARSTKPEDLVGRDEHVSNVLRLRKAAVLAIIVWPLFGLIDWFITSFVHSGRLWVYLSARSVGMFFILVATAMLFARKMPSPTTTRIIDGGMCFLISALITVTCLEFGGIDSPLAMGVVIVIVSRSALLSQNWRGGVVPIGMAAIAHPVTLLVVAALVPDMGAQFDDRTAVAGFVLNQAFVFSAAAISVVGGHVVWALRRQIFESRSLGRYRLKKRIGAGGMGEVWAAHHNGLGRDVAVKILRADCNETAVARFEREVRATAELTHPNTVRVFDYGTTEDGLWYYAMELLNGYDMAALVAREGVMEPFRACRLIWQASKALAEAHSRGITHRDVKPENLFVTSLGGEQDFIKVLDFGLAKLAEADQSATLTHTGFAVGTPKYVSPEVVFGNEADPRSDVYGLGAVLYYMVSGRAPFEHNDMRRTLMAHVREQVQPPSKKLGRALPEAIEALIMRCLEKDPERRFADAGQLALAIEAAVEESYRAVGGASAKPAFGPESHLRAAAAPLHLAVPVSHRPERAPQPMVSAAVGTPTGGYAEGYGPPTVLPSKDFVREQPARVDHRGARAPVRLPTDEDSGPPTNYEAETTIREHHYPSAAR